MNDKLWELVVKVRATIARQGHLLGEWSCGQETASNECAVCGGRVELVLGNQYSDDRVLGALPHLSCSEAQRRGEDELAQWLVE